jgi:uncharacterized protein YydD (DUF2326 family)
MSDDVFEVVVEEVGTDKEKESTYNSTIEYLIRRYCEVCEDEESYSIS